MKNIIGITRRALILHILTAIGSIGVGLPLLVYWLTIDSSYAIIALFIPPAIFIPMIIWINNKFSSEGE